MKRKFWLVLFLLPIQLFAQDSTLNNLMKGMEGADNGKKQPVKTFSSERTVNANTTETVGKGKMDFRVTHNFGDIGGTYGGVKTFFGLDAITDLRIGFHIGLTDKLDLNVARVKGADPQVTQLYELALKYKLMDQVENDPSHPVALALFANTTVSARKADTAANLESSYKGFSDRMSQTIQLIIARKFGKISLQLNPTFVHTNYVVTNDENSLFALGGAVRLPVTKNFNIIVDYFHPFRSQSSKDFFATRSVKFSDPIGISFEILTAGHVFSLNFTNATEILENRFIPRTTTSWSKGEFRWGFTISRKFVLWRNKTK
ncbi:MAG: DUF5777 family beta-barrel protein [Bacteroidota bacterium]|nr:DUF5777 family beta-barrel protein [Bacteroidota bacterium]